MTSSNKCGGCRNYISVGEKHGLCSKLFTRSEEMVNLKIDATWGCLTPGLFEPANAEGLTEMNEDEVLEVVGDDYDLAHSLLLEKMPGVEKKWERLCASIKRFLCDVQKHFPDAQYYTASGGFNLMLGDSHSTAGKPQQQLVALSGIDVEIGDGDF